MLENFPEPTTPCRGELVEMENLLRLNSLCVTCMADLSSHPLTKPGCNFLARPIRVWRCYPQLRMHWNFTQYTCQLPGTDLAASRPATHTGLISSGHLGLDQRSRLMPESGLDNATIDSGCLPGACDMWMQIQVQNGSMILLQKGLMPAAVVQLNAAIQLGSRFRYVLIKTLFSFCHTLAGHINRISNACKLQKLQMLSLYEYYM